MDITEIIFFILIASGLLLYAFSRRRRYRETHRPSALAAFNALTIPSENKLLQFNGQTAQVMDEKEVVEQHGNRFLAYTLTRIARNQAGEYFWLYFRTDSRLQIKHIDQSRAKILLKDKYLAPQSSQHNG